MNADEYDRILRIVWAIIATVDRLPLDEMRVAQALIETQTRLVTFADSTNQVNAFLDDCEATRLVADLRDGVRKLKADGDARRTRRQSVDHGQPRNPPTGH